MYVCLSVCMYVTELLRGRSMDLLQNFWRDASDTRFQYHIFFVTKNSRSRSQEWKNCHFTDISSLYSLSLVGILVGRGPPIQITVAPFNKAAGFGADQDIVRLTKAPPWNCATIIFPVSIGIANALAGFRAKTFAALMLIRKLSFIQLFSAIRRYLSIVWQGGIYARNGMTCDPLCWLWVRVTPKDDRRRGHQWHSWWLETWQRQALCAFTMWPFMTSGSFVTADGLFTYRAKPLAVWQLGSHCISI